MATVNCNLCGADDYTVLFPKGHAQLHRIVRCNRCSLMYANPQELVDCARFESDAATATYDPNLPGHRQYAEKQRVQLPDNERALRVLNELFPRRGRLLEIGTYLGFFLSRIRAAGWDVTGLEPERPVADYTRAQLGLPIIDKVLAEAGLPEQSFDAVVMLHVIEHMPNPSEDLRQIHRVLKPGGVLVVETPRFDSLAFRLLGRRERSMCNCNGHIFFFTVATLRQLLERQGFEVFRVDLVGRTLTGERLLYNVGLVSRSRRIQQGLARLSRTLRLDRLRLHLNVHDMQRVYARAR